MIEIISGTNRPQSNSYKIALLYQQILFEKDAEANVLNIADLPQNFIFNDLYKKESTNAFLQLKTRVKNANAVVFIIPEYNGSYPGVLKAFIDGFDYPADFSDKQAAIVGLSAGTQGNANGISHLTDVLSHMGFNIIGLRPRLADFYQNFDGNVLTNKLYLELLHKQANILLQLVKQQNRHPAF